MSNTTCIVLVLAAGIGGCIAGIAVTKRMSNPLNWFR